MVCNTLAEIDLDTIKSNIDVIREYVSPNTKICVVLKADAYGFGLEGMAKYLTELSLVDMIAVGTIRELPVALDAAAEDFQSLVIGYCSPYEIIQILKEYPEYLDRAVFSGFNIEQLRQLNRLADEEAMSINIHIRLDNMSSGMGFSYDEFKSCKDEIFEFSNLKITGIYSHFYTSYDSDEDALRAEISRFDEAVSTIDEKDKKDLTIHLMNSGMVFRFPEGIFDMVRLGSAIYGLMEERGLRTALSIKGKVFAVSRISEDSILGYMDESKSKSERIIARIMIGSVDLPTLLTSKNVRVRINDGLYPLADIACMDNICVDVTYAFPPVKVDDEAVLVGGDGLTIMDIVARGDIDYIHAERICINSSRLQKRYVGDVLCQKD